MHLQQLIQTLTHGYSCTITEEDGTQRIDFRPPNTHMIQAAKVIVEIYQKNESLQEIIRNQQYQINKLLKDENETVQP